MRAIPLVGGADDRVGTPASPIDPPVGSGGDGIDVRAGAGISGECAQGGDVRGGADDVRRGGEDDPPGAVGHDGGDVLGLENQRVPVGLGEAHGGARPLRCQHPGSNIAVVVEPGHDDLVTRAEGSADGRREPHRERGHRLAEDDAVRPGAEKFCAHVTRRPHERIGGRRLWEQAVRVGGVARPPPRGGGLDHVVDGLCAGRPIEPNPLVTEPGEALAIHPPMLNDLGRGPYDARPWSACWPKPRGARFAQADQADQPGDHSSGPGVIDPDVQDVGPGHSVLDRQPDRDNAQRDGGADGRGQLRADATPPGTLPPGRSRPGPTAARPRRPSRRRRRRAVPPAPSATSSTGRNRRSRWPTRRRRPCGTGDRRW